MKKSLRSAVNSFVLLVAASSQAAVNDGFESLPKGLDIGAIAQPDLTPHQGIPEGVPSDFDWQATSRIRSLTVPPGFSALTGWGQFFWRAGAGSTDQSVELKESQTLLCEQNGSAVTWRRVQSGKIEGAAFNPDYKDNVNTPAVVDEIAPNVYRVQLEPGKAFHFWPLGRASFSQATQLCGVVYLLQARAVRPGGAEMGVASEQPSFLIGGGVDYWKSISAHWPENSGVGVGQLRSLSIKWHWYGFSTASPQALHILERDGFLP
jgi:hypothetical protein